MKFSLFITLGIKLVYKIRNIYGHARVFEKPITNEHF